MTTCGFSVLQPRRAAGCASLERAFIAARHLQAAGLPSTCALHIAPRWPLLRMSCVSAARFRSDSSQRATLHARFARCVQMREASVVCQGSHSPQVVPRPQCRGLPSELVAIVKAAVAFETASGSDDTGAGGASSAQRSITRKKASPTPEVLPSPSVSAKGASQGHASLSAAPHTRSKGRCPSPSSRVPAPLGVTAAGADDAAFEAATATASSGSSAGAAADQAEVAEGDAETGDADDDDDDDDDAASSQTAPKG